MRDLGLVFTAFGLVPIGVGLVIVVLSLFSLFGHKLPTLTALVAIPLIATGALELLLWNRLFPRSLRSDATGVTLVAALEPQRIPRSDVRLIYRGQIFKSGGRSGSAWIKSYIFAASDGQVGMSVAAISFTDEGMISFAQRLQVPMKGDFSVQVKDRVDPAAQ